MPQSTFDDVKPWPTTAPAAISERLHNRPPLAEIIPAEFREALLADKPDFLEVLEENVTAALRARADDDETLGRCGSLVKRYRALLSHVSDVHKAVKQPYLDGGRLVDAEKNALVERIELAKRRVEGVSNAYVAKKDAEARAERERIMAEQRAAAERAAAAERERERAEAEARRAAEESSSDVERAMAEAMAAEAARESERAMSEAALAPAATDKPEPVRSDEGAVISGRQEWKSEVIDYDVAYMAVADNPKVREAIEKAVAGLVRAGKREIEGVRIWPVAKANFH